MSKLYIGTSGYSYVHWEKGVFYPKDLPKAKQLQYYASCFNTVELNSPFYHLPTAKTFSNWRRRVPEGFIFAVKVSRFITHIKKLSQCKSAWRTFLERAVQLKEKLGPFLFQLPPSFSPTEKNVKNLKNFLKIISAQSDLSFRYAFEFRHPDWCQNKIYDILRKYKITWVIADSPSYPKAEVITSNFVYIRMHGSRVLFSSDYTEEELKNLSRKIRRYLKQKLDVYCYFNNDAHGYAPKNAKTLSEILKGRQLI